MRAQGASGAGMIKSLCLDSEVQSVGFRVLLPFENDVGLIRRGFHLLLPPPYAANTKLCAEIHAGL